MIDRKQIESMASIMAALNNATGDEPIDVSSRKVPTSDKSMASIMEAFRSAVDNVVMTNTPEVKLALETEKTSDGVSIGAWKITVRENAGSGNYYDIRHKDSEHVIAADLRLYEAAHAIVKLLDSGETFTSPIIKSVLDFENDYSRALSDALIFSQKSKLTEGAQHDIAQARLSESKRRATVAKMSIAKLVK
jgi:hypothetical protein